MCDMVVAHTQMSCCALGATHFSIKTTQVYLHVLDCGTKVGSPADML